MKQVDLKRLVELAVGAEWSAFEIRHPSLARALDRRILIEQYAQSLRERPEFVEAMRQVEAAGLAHEVLQEDVGRVVRRLLRGEGW